MHDELCLAWACWQQSLQQKNHPQEQQGQKTWSDVVKYR